MAIKKLIQFEQFLTYRKKPPVFIGWVGLRTGLDVVEKRNILPLPGIQRRPSSP
jgi:hypothetical protein